MVYIPSSQYTRCRVWDYFKRFFREIVKGRKDYEHLLSLTID
ncbi:hypothetical protein BACDOR_04500 [Phocaeicola dorei DSM 17855]|uniref:Uncharacterized protein n=1 Tax=Phocaeicola dorei DSM 17855 TaxID=483217 RepID=B6W4K0_9BACT|nr:hypothetical protein BACDOR_04500 [Phocaeicola dorei DSM 17855]